MKSVSLLLKSILPLLLALVTVGSAFADTRLPVCSGTGTGVGTGQVGGPPYSGQGYIYVLGTDENIYKIDPNLATINMVPTTVSVPRGATALAVSRNLNGGTVTPTYYTVVQIGTLKYLHYYNGLTWTNTGQVFNSNNISGGGGFIFGIDCASGNVIRWSPPSTSAILVTNVGNVGSCDLASDCSGNFYVINQVDSSFRMFNSSGTQLYRDTLKGTRAPGGQGLSVMNGKVYYDGSDGKLYQGIINNFTKTVTFTASSTAPFTTIPVADFGACGSNGVGPGVFATDTVAICGTPQSIELHITLGNSYPNWRVLSGPALIGTSSYDYTIVYGLTGVSVILHDDPDCSGANTLIDTTVLFVSKATVNAGPDHNVIGCNGVYQDTLHGSITDTTVGVSYAIEWTLANPVAGLGTILSGNTTLDPIVAPIFDTSYVMRVFTLGGCNFYDTIRVHVADSTPHANFTYSIRPGCDEDTVKFINTTRANPFINSVYWDFGDTTYSSAVSPVHIYQNQGIYNVVLAIANNYCVDTLRRFVNVLHPLQAAFTVDDSTVCAGTRVVFTNRSVAPPINGVDPTFRYTFGDGGTSSLASPTHDYTKAGTFIARLVIRNALGCSDTTYRTIVVDSTPYATLYTADTSICEGKSITLAATYLSVGSTGISYNLGDGTIFDNTENVTYSFAQAGTYNVVLTAHYRICPDIVVNKEIVVHPFPGIDLGADTVLCPNGSPIVLSDRINIGNPSAKYLWSTGETTASINAKDIGTYWARVTVAGCSGTDSILVHKDCYVDIPNSFTPNGDGSNDYFLPRQFLSRSVNSFKMSIYNRWGQIIYESSTINGRGWDGRFNDKAQPQGVYVYIIDVSFDNGVKEHYTGNVTLLR